MLTLKEHEKSRKKHWIAYVADSCITEDGEKHSLAEKQLWKQPSENLLSFNKDELYC